MVVVPVPDQSRAARILRDGDTTGRQAVVILSLGYDEPSEHPQRAGRELYPDDENPREARDKPHFGEMPASISLFAEKYLTAMIPIGSVHHGHR